jgi:tetratricopeptide (TPR) repeat protein
MVSKPVHRMGCMWVVMALALPAPVVAQTAAAPAAPTAPTAEEQVKKVEALASEAQAKYAEGNYQDSIRLYLQAHQLVAEPAILYNVAVIYDQQVRDPEIATEYYRRYIMDPGADPEAVTRATQRIQELRAQKEAAATAAAARPAPASAAPTSETAGVDATAEPEQGLSTMRLAVGWGLVGLGAALGVAGGIFGGLAESDEHAFTDSGDIIEKRDLRDRGQQRALAADLFFGGAGVAVVAGVVVLLTGERGAERESAPRAGVAPTPGGAQATFDFRF